MKRKLSLTLGVLTLVGTQVFAKPSSVPGPPSAGSPYTDGYTYLVGTIYNPNDADWVIPGINGLSTGSVWISDAAISAGNNTTNPLSFPLYATNAAGVFTGNDMPLSVTGYALDGILNGGNQTGGQIDPLLDPNNIFAGGAFITPEYLQNLDKGDEADDPGWLSIYKDDTGFLPLQLIDFDLSSYMAVNVTYQSGTDQKKGDWSITYNNPTGLLAALKKTVYGDSFFDHLALTFKAGNAFAIFDFDFNLINSFTNDAFDLSKPYNLAGGFDLTKSPSLSAHGISHVTFSVRDPLNTPVPTPTPLALLAAGLLGLSLRAARRRSESLRVIFPAACGASTDRV